jgi:putative nucleotidyltransferase with HDIG domain
VTPAVGDPLDHLSQIPGRAWLVGGALRDRLLGRPTADYDVALDGDPKTVAKRLARAASGHAFELSQDFGIWRVMARDRRWQIDLTALAGPTIEADLARRDLTVNAIAQDVHAIAQDARGGELVDPFGGVRDLEQRRLRMVSPGAFDSDPLRVLRLARLATELDFLADPETARTAALSAPGLAGVAPERVLGELKRIIASERAVEGVRLLDHLGITAVILPELDALHGVQQSRFHHLDVYEHTLAVLAETIALQRDPEPSLGAHAATVSELLSQPLANELTRWHALRLGALLHDIAKPQTREVTAEGRVTFIGHDAAGGQTAGLVLTRLRASERLTEHVAALARNHLRLGFLVHELPLSRRTIYRYLRASEPVQVDVTVLSVADRLATRGERSNEAIARHLELADEMLGEALEWIADPPRPPLRGDELARRLDLRPGPELGRILAELEEASFAHEIGSTDEAVERARQLVGRRGG